MGSLPGIIGAFAKLQKWLKVYAAQSEAQTALRALEVGAAHEADIPEAAEIHFRGEGKRRYAVDKISFRRLPDAKGKKAAP